MGKRGENIYKRKDGRWEGRFFDGRFINGRKHYVSVYGRTYREVKEKISSAKKMSAYPGSCRLTFEQAGLKWLDYIKLRVKPSTYANYLYLFTRHLHPYFGNTDMKKLTKTMVHQFIDDKLSHGRLNGKGGVSHKYMRDMLSIVKSIAAFCEDQYDIISQIANVKSRKPEQREMKVLTEPQQKHLSVYLMENLTEQNLGILLSLYTGLRLGEVCGLLWEDFDDETGSLRVGRTVQRISDNKGSTYLAAGTPKTSASMRYIPLPQFLWNILSERKAEKNMPIISNNMRYTEPATLRRSFKSSLHKCGLPEIRYHDLRHTFATTCVQKQFDVKALSEILGHANSAMTLNRYVHPSMEQKRHYMNLL